MARRLLIAGTNRWSDYERGSLRIEAALTYQIDTCRFDLRGERPNEGDEVIIEDDALAEPRLFAGVVTKVELVKRGRQMPNLWQVDCDDYTALLDRYLVVEVYENTSASDIFLDIVNKYCPGFTTNGVRAGAPVVEYLSFDYVRPSECFRQLCDYVGWHWEPDYYKDLSFFSAEELASAAPLSLVPGGRFRDLKHTINTRGLRNRVYVRGGSMLSDPWTHEVVADGKARAWVLPHKPHELTMTVSESPVTVGIENVHEEADYDYLMNYQEKYVRCSAQTATPVNGATLSFTYRYDIPVITMVEDLESQEALAAVQGGDGVYEHVIVDDSLTTIDAAEAAGLADLRGHANPQVKGTFETEVPGWAPGQLVDINLPDRGVTGTFLVQKVTITPASTDLWTYHVEYGGRLKGVADFLKALVSAQQKKQLAETTLLQKFAYGQDETAIEDEIEATPVELPMVVEESKDFLVVPEAALAFDGVDDYVQLGNPSQLQITGDQTIEMWIRPASLNARRNPYAKAYGGEGTITQESKGYVNYYYGTAGGNTSPYQGFLMTSPLAINKWTHLAIVRDLTNMMLYWYKDGVLTDFAPANYAQAAVSSLDAYIGQGYVDNYHGDIDEVRIWNIARRQNEIQHDMYRRLNGNEPGLVAYYRMDEGFGSSASDDTPYSNDGTIYGAAWTTRLGYLKLPTIGTLLNITQANPADRWPYPEISTSEDGETWTDWRPVGPLERAIEVPYPGYVRIRIRALGKVRAYNYKRAFDETLVVCGVVEVG